MNLADTVLNKLSEADLGKTLDTLEASLEKVAKDIPLAYVASRSSENRRMIQNEMVSMGRKVDELKQMLTQIRGQA